MPKRSTRNRVRYQARKAIDKVTGIDGHLARIDEMIGEQSDAVKKQLPLLLAMTTTLKDFLVAFRATL